MVTAMSQQIMVISALKAGGRDFVAKPFDAEQLKYDINRMLI
jgi:FixJ family two-component response regulator